jgi:hypothetical protein
MLAVLLSALSGCAGAAKVAPQPAGQRTAAPDVVEFARLWHGARDNCAELPALAGAHLAANEKRWKCVVRGWDSVILTVVPGPPAILQLNLRNENPHACALERFAEKVENVDGMIGNVVSETFAALEGGAFDGTCASVTMDWTRGSCQVVITAPSKRACGWHDVGIHP